MSDETETLNGETGRSSRPYR